MFRVFYAEGADSTFEDAVELTARAFESLEDVRQYVAGNIEKDTEPYNYWIIQVAEEYVWKKPEVKIDAPQEAK